MRRELAGEWRRWPLGDGGATSRDPRPPSAQDDDVTMTVGLIQDMSSPNVDRRVPRVRLRDVEPAVRHAHRQGGRRLRDDPGARRVVGGLGRRADVHVHACARGCSGRDGEPLTAEDVAYTINRSRDEEWVNHYSTVAEPRRRRRSTTARSRSSSVGARSEAADDGRLHRPQAHLRADLGRRRRRATTRSTASPPGQYSLTEWRSGQDWTMVKNPNWYGRDNGIDRIVFRVFTNADAMVAAIAAGRDRRRPRHPAPTRSSSSRATRTSRSSTASRAGSPSWRSTAWRAASATATRRCRTSTSATPSTTPIDRDVLFERVDLGLGSGRHDDVAVGRHRLDPRPRRRELHLRPRPRQPDARRRRLPRHRRRRRARDARRRAGRSSSATSSAPSRDRARRSASSSPGCWRHRHRHRSSR